MPRNDRCGVYVIEHLDSGLLYIGSSKAIYMRWYSHRMELKRGNHHSPRLQNTWTKYGPDAFKFSILEECSPDELLSKEQEYLDAFKPAFNVCSLARSRAGSRQRPESVAKLAASQRARLASRTHCPSGHEYTPENTALYQKARVCRECARQWSRERFTSLTPEQRARKKALAAAYYQNNKDAHRQAASAYAEAHKAHLAERARQRREQLKAEETAEQRTARLAHLREQYYANIEVRRENGRRTAARYRVRQREKKLKE